jgi:hypothetical protein
MMEISQITTTVPISKRDGDYVPFRNRIRYHREADFKTHGNANHHCNSYIDLLNFNLDEIGCQFEKVIA